MQIVRVRIKDTHDSCLKSIRSIGKNKTYERDTRKNNIIMNTIIRGISEGKICYLAYDNGDDRFICYHKSTREGVDIQCSFGRYENGKMVPSGHENIKDVSDLRITYPSGYWKYAIA